MNNVSCTIVVVELIKKGWCRLVSVTSRVSVQSLQDISIVGGHTHSDDDKGGCYLHASTSFAHYYKQLCHSDILSLSHKLISKLVGYEISKAQTWFVF